MDLEAVDFFTDTEVVTNPYPYFDALRSRCPVHPVAHPNVVAVTGYDEAVEVYKDASTFSSCNSVGGPYPPLQVQPGATDIADVIETHRHEWPMSEFMVTMDGAAHEAERSLLRRLLTPRQTQGERGGAGRYRRRGHRHIHRQWPLRSHQRVRQTVYHVGDRRSAWCA